MNLISAVIIAISVFFQYRVQAVSQYLQVILITAELPLVSVFFYDNPSRRTFVNLSASFIILSCRHTAFQVSILSRFLVSPDTIWYTFTGGKTILKLL